ncbi:hypothetical protein ACQ4PT_068715 [Festuca glaucescens]
MDYADYDGHRHPVRVLPGTPLREWFAESLGGEERDEIMVNSYHHQGVRRLVEQFVPMAFAPDGLVEGGSTTRTLAYCEFVRAVVAYEAKLATVPARGRWAATMPKLSHDMEKQRKVLVRSFSLAKNMYLGGGDTQKPAAEAERRDLDAGAEFLETAAAALSWQQEKRLKQMGATVRNASGYLNSTLKVSEEREAAARAVMVKMSAAQLSSLATLYRAMGAICADVLDAKLQPASPTPRE